jgi:hypothetical protein
MVELPTLSHDRKPNLTLTQPSPALGAKPSWPREFRVSQQEATMGCEPHGIRATGGTMVLKDGRLTTRAEKVVSLVSDA